MPHTIGIYFDLGHPPQQTPGLANYLNSFASATRAGDRLWFVLTDKTPIDVKNDLDTLPFMQAGFTTVVWAVGQSWGYHGYDPNADQWLINNWVPS